MNGEIKVTQSLRDETFVEKAINKNQSSVGAEQKEKGDVHYLFIMMYIYVHSDIEGLDFEFFIETCNRASLK